jgi:hypothetical protein
MSAWPKVEKFIEETYKNDPQSKPFVLKVFVMPEMTAQQYLKEWLPKHRKTDYESRAVRAGWELRHAPSPSAAHLLVTNVIDQTGVSLEWEAKALLNLMGNLFPIGGAKLPYYKFPSVSPGIVSTSDVLAFQDKLTR